MRHSQFHCGLICFAILFALGNMPARARPRDEVMSAAYRCAPIANSRQWLDCYYGAAQPVRLALGLKPATAAQLKLASSPPASNEEPKDVEIRDQVIAQATACREFSDDRRWLDCYYASTQPMRAVLGLPYVPQAMAMPQNYPGSPRQVQSGEETGEAGLPSQVNHVESSLASYSFRKGGFFTVKLANGQAWHQVDGDTDQAHWKKPASTYVVRITRGFLNSYNLQVKGLPGKYKILPGS